MRYDRGVYLTNRYFHLIPINPEGYDYLNLSQTQDILLNFDSKGKYADGVAAVADKSLVADVYIVCSSTLIGDRVERMWIKKNKNLYIYNKWIKNVYTIKIGKEIYKSIWIKKN